MSSPTYGDLGSACSGLFGGGYHFGLINVSYKTKVEDSVEIKAGGSLCKETDVFSGNTTTSFKMKDYGLTLTEKWNTNNTLATEISIENQLVDGLKLCLEGSFSAASGQRTLRGKSLYRTDNFSLNVDADSSGPVISGSTVLGINKWLVGYQMAFDSSKSEVTQSNVAVDYALDDLVFHTGINNGRDFSGSIYRKVNPQLETGIQLGWRNVTSSSAQFGMGCKYSLNENIVLRAKMDESFSVGLSIQEKIQDGITCTISALINGKNINEGGHKFGIALDFEA